MVGTPDFRLRDVKMTSMSNSDDIRRTKIKGSLDQIYDYYSFFIEETTRAVVLVDGIVGEKTDHIDTRLGSEIRDIGGHKHTRPRVYVTKSEKGRRLGDQLALLGLGQGFLSEMALVYLIALQEGFIKDYLFALLTARRELLRSEETVTYRELAAFESLDSMIAYIAQRKIDELTGIDEVAKFFEKRLGLSLENDFRSWTQLVEANCRRNMIVHNQGKTNKTYCRKTGHKEQDEHLDTNIEYVQKISSVVGEFVYFIHSKLSSRFAARESVN